MALAAFALHQVQERSGTAALATRLRALEGRTGLDPLDPARPLVVAEVVAVGTPRPDEGGERVAEVRFTYADGSARNYRTWLSHRTGFFGGWRYSGLDRAFAPHLELPGLPLAESDAPLHLGTPVPLAAEELPPLNNGSAHALELLFGSSGSLWSPSGDAVLVAATDPGIPGPALWLVPLGGGHPRRLAPAADLAAWAPNGRSVVYRAHAGGAHVLAAVRRDGAPVWSLRLDGNPPPPFAVAGDAVHFARHGAIWRMPLGAAPGTTPDRVRDLPGVRLESWLGEPPPIAVDPAAGLVVYACGPDLCLAGIEGGEPVRVAAGDQPSALPLTPVPPRPVPVGPYPGPASGAIPGDDPAAAEWPVVRAAWSLDGQRLAAVWADRWFSDRGRRPWLAVLDRTGRVLAQAEVGPNGPVDAPFWTPDGRFLLLRAYPEQGRRVIAVEVATGRVLDLTQPGWDALFSASPDGSRLLLTNGRGGLWVAPVERR